MALPQPFAVRAAEQCADSATVGRRTTRMRFRLEEIRAATSAGDREEAGRARRAPHGDEERSIWSPANWAPGGKTFMVKPEDVETRIREYASNAVTAFVTAAIRAGSPLAKTRSEK
jgi:hypothetical protein